MAQGLEYVMSGNERVRRRMMTRIQWWVLIAIVVLLISLCCVEVMRGEDPPTANREALERDLWTLALRAQEYYFRPAAKGGGQGAFDNSKGGAGLCWIAQLASKPSSSNGSFTLGTVTATCVVLTATGTQRGTDGNLIQVNEIVFPDSIFLTFNN
jgi:hypothetical protein